MRYKQLLDTLQNLIKRKPSQNELGKILGLAQTSMSGRAMRNSNISDEEIELLNSAYNIDIYKSITRDNASDNVELDYYPEVFGSCGNGSFVASEIKEKISVPKSCFFNSYDPSKTYSIINARGNSMEPFIFDKDFLMVEHWSGEQIVDNQIYVFCYGNEIFVKRLQKNVNQLIIKSDNKDYDVIKLLGADLEQVYIIGRITGLARNLR